MSRVGNLPENNWNIQTCPLKMCFLYFLIDCITENNIGGVLPSWQ
jgi:hypothetical protein